MFIKVTSNNTGAKVRININRIYLYCPVYNKTTTHIEWGDGDSPLESEESPEEIDAMISRFPNMGPLT